MKKIKRKDVNEFTKASIVNFVSTELDDITSELTYLYKQCSKYKNNTALVKSYIEKLKYFSFAHLSWIESRVTTKVSKDFENLVRESYSSAKTNNNAYKAFTNFFNNVYAFLKGLLEGVENYPEVTLPMSFYEGEPLEIPPLEHSKNSKAESIVKANESKYDNEVNKIETKHEIRTFVHSSKEVLVVGKLTLNLGSTILQYKKNKPLDIEPDSKPIKFLVLLMSNANKLIEYTEIAKQVELSCYHEGVSNKDVALEVHYVRRDLGIILEKAGMTKEEINVLIVPKKNIGYKLVTIIPETKSYSTETQ
ncbi:hypothetical protein HY212_04740 [Candidatus Pacearchaeota archaeon]|nr:hypothetical protein [Candidatus Pacearchaeota archaeon]